MVRLIFISADGRREEIEATLGETLMHAAVRNKIAAIEGSCGGNLVCGTCHAYIAEPWFSKLAPPAEDEAQMLSFGVHIRENSRQLCQIRASDLLDGAEIETPVSQI